LGADWRTSCPTSGACGTNDEDFCDGKVRKRKFREDFCACKSCGKRARVRVFQTIA
jgi:hypothetical protein